MRHNRSELKSRAAGGYDRPLPMLGAITVA
jgi:hypothetical protein